MPNAKRDSNFVTTLIGVSSVDGVTPVPVQVNPVTGALLTEGHVGSSSNPPSTRIVHDANAVAVTALVNSVDGVTPLALTATSSGIVRTDG